MTTGYGEDIWCGSSMTPGKYARGKVVVAQALYRRLITPRGTLRGGDDEANYGFDVSGYVGAVGSETAIATLPARIQAELRKDDRVTRVDVEVVSAYGSAGDVTLTIDVRAALADSEETLAFTLEVSETSTQLLGGFS